VESAQIESAQIETALLLVCPDAEFAVSTHRARLDRAAGDGVPAHITVIYPFKSLELMTTADQRCLDEVAAMFNTISMRASRTGWFGDSVLYLAPDDPTPIALLTRHVWTAFPDFPPYGGKFAEAVPHLTIGHDHSLDELKAAERSVNLRLPVIQELDHLELWTGPRVEGRTHRSSWGHVRDYQLGDAAPRAGTATA